MEKTPTQYLHRSGWGERIALLLLSLVLVAFPVYRMYIEKEITFKAADSELKDKTKAVAGIVEEKIGEKDTIDSILTNKKEAILDALAGKDRKDTNMYLVSYATKVKYDSKLFNTLNEGINALEIAQKIGKNKVVHVSTEIGNYEAKGTGMMAFQDVTVNGKTYTIVVMKVDMQKKATK